MCAKEIGVKMKQEEPIGDDTSVPPDLLEKLCKQVIVADDIRVRESS